MKQLKELFRRKTSIWLAFSLILVTIALWWTFDPLIVNTYVMRLPVGYDLDRIVKLEVASSVAIREMGEDRRVPTEDWYFDTEEQQMLSARIEKFFDRLSPRQRQIINLYYMEQRKYDDICRIMGINYQSVRNLMHRGMLKLREAAM